MPSQGFKPEQLLLISSSLFIFFVVYNLKFAPRHNIRAYGNSLISGVHSRSLLSEAECAFNQSAFCASQECTFSPPDTPRACCRSVNGTVDDETLCVAQNGGQCVFKDLCVAELLPGGPGSAECLAEWELTGGTGIFVYILILLYLFLAIAIVADDYFTASLDRIGNALGLSEDVVGATFAAAGSSAPEFFVSLADNVIAAEPKSFGIGTIIGSAVFNVLVIIGLSALFAKLPEGAEKGTPMKVDYRPLTRDSVFYVASILALTVVLLNESVEWYEGLILCILYAPYIVFMAYNKKFYAKLGHGSTKMLTSDLKKSMDETFDEEEETPAKTFPSRRLSGPVGSFRGFDEDVGELKPYFDNLHWPLYEGKGSEEESYLARALLHWDTMTTKRLYFIVVFPINFCYRFTIPDSDHDIFHEDKDGKPENRRINYSLEFFSCVIWIGILAYVLVFAAAKLGCLIGVPPEVMGLTVLAAGTSVPDTLTSVLVARRGKYDMAISNALGSNVFNIFIGLGFPWFAGALKLGGPIPVDASDLIYSVLFLLSTLLISVLLLRYYGWCISKKYGFLLSLMYLVYIIIEILKIIFPDNIRTSVDLSAFN